MSRPAKRLDPVRRRLLGLVEANDTNLKAVSLAIGRNHAYLQQFLRRQRPQLLAEDDRRALARHFGIDEADLLMPTQASAVPEPPRRRLTQWLPSFAARLAVARGQSEHELPGRFASAAGIAQGRYRALEDGADDPTLDELDRISRTSGRSLQWLVRGDASEADGAPAETGPEATDRLNPIDQ